MDGVSLSGERVLLRKSTPHDHAELARIFSDPAVMEFLQGLQNGPAGWTLEQVAQREATFERLQKLGKALTFVVADKRTSLVLGTCGFHLLAALNRSAQFGIILDRPGWGRGVAAECHLLCFGYAFETLGMHRIEMETDARNVRMRGFLAGVGIGQEFVRKESLFEGGAFSDSVGYACFDRDWARVKDALTERRDGQQR
ncbi:MAG TPA: GNAT family N-acetyltransferase [Myxococcales bacterium]|jgi:RimJ/RimL family protein N-acetyltransferase